MGFKGCLGYTWGTLREICGYLSSIASTSNFKKIRIEFSFNTISSKWKSMLTTPATPVKYQKRLKAQASL